MTTCTATKCEFYSRTKFNNCCYEEVMGCVLPCKGGKNCHFNPNKHPGKDVDLEMSNYVNMSKEKVAELEERRRMFFSGMSVAEIAEAQGRKKANIHQWLTRNELIPPRRKNNK